MRKRLRWPLLLVVIAWLATAAPLRALETPQSSGNPRDVTLVALTADGRMIVFRADRPAEVAVRGVTGIDDPLCGIDYRPSNGLLYGVTTSNEVVTIDAATGIAQRVSTLTKPFGGETRSGVDFNPATDRLRLVAAEGQNLRVNVDVGATAVDGPLVYRSGDPGFGSRPAIAGVAYTKNIPGSALTEMFDIDYARDTLVRQEPPNDGVLQTVGALGVDAPPLAGFEIVSGEGGREDAYAAFGDTLYAIDLATGQARELGRIGGTPGAIVGLTQLGASAAGAP
jgi:hypothetical protein